MRLGFAGVLAALALAACQPAAEAPDAIFHGGTIYTGVDGAPTVEAVSVKDGRILKTGTSADLLKTANEATQKIDLAGAFLYPGFTDAHAHLFGIGERELTLNLDQVKSIAELVSIVGETAKVMPPGLTLQGRGWIETHWPEKRFPTRQDIDAVTGDRPTVLTRADGHALLANTAALKAAGIDGKPASQPDGGRIEVGADGLPTGMLIDNAMAAMASLRREPTTDDIYRAYETADAREISLGWTGLHNMSVPLSHVARINALSDSGKLKLRIWNAIDGESFDSATFGESQNKLVTTGAIKLYMDGALGSRGALLSAPYSDQPETLGLQRSDETETLALLRKAYDADIQVAFHAIGDEGNRRVLGWMEKTFTDAGGKIPSDRRWRIEHSQILHIEDIPRFKQLGIIASMQPSHAIGDLYFAPARLGQDRLAGAYAWRALIDAGATVAGGSDAPVEQGDPRIEFYAAVARKDQKGFSGEGWHPEEAVTREQALKMFTLWAAYAAFEEKLRGSIEVGKLADLTILSADIMTIPAPEILKTRCVMTVINGEIVYQGS